MGGSIFFKFLINRGGGRFIRQVRVSNSETMYGNLPFLVLNQLSMYVRRLTKQNQPIFIPNKKLCSQIKEDETSSTGLLSGGGKGENFMGYLGLVLFRTEVGGRHFFGLENRGLWQ